MSNNNNFEDVEGLRNLVEELKENMKRNQEVTAKIRREKNELLMKVSKAMADIKERDDQLDAIQKQSQLDKGSHHDQQGQQQQLNQMDQETQGKLSIVTANMNDTPPSSSLSPPPPPPPPPPPLPPLPLSSQPTMMDQYKQNNDDSEQDIPLPPVIRRRNLVRRNSAHRASKYLHPLAINLCFPNLKSLHESTANASSPTTNDVLPFKDPVKKNVSPTMKQFFWSKLPVDKIENTVWKEISSVKTSHSVISDLSSITSSDTEDSVEAEDLLDTVELERLFKKKSSTKQQNQEEKNEPMRRQITLLEFNRANNIAIMLAKIRLPYPDIRDAIWNIDDNMLTVDNLMSIRQYIPTKEEVMFLHIYINSLYSLFIQIELVKEYQGDVELLGNAERYFRAVSQVIHSARTNFNLSIF